MKKEFIKFDMWDGKEVENSRLVRISDISCAYATISEVRPEEKNLFCIHLKMNNGDHYKSDLHSRDSEEQIVIDLEEMLGFIDA